MAIGPAAPDEIVLPKVESACDVRTADWLLTQLEIRHGLPPGRIGLAPILETASGIAAAQEVARAGSRVRWLMFGAVDLALDMDLDLDDDAGAIAQARFAVALASRRRRAAWPDGYGVRRYSGARPVAASARRARAMGYSGKACIHPAQISVVNEVFTPSARELERARRIVEAFAAAERAGSAAVAWTGR